MKFSMLCDKLRNIVRLLVEFVTGLEGLRGLGRRDPRQEIRATIFPEAEAENSLELCFNLENG
jgi:hypothetical protein